jgi:hypothetical protein
MCTLHVTGVKTSRQVNEKMATTHIRRTHTQQVDDAQGRDEFKQK